MRHVLLFVVLVSAGPLGCRDSSSGGPPSAGNQGELGGGLPGPAVPDEGRASTTTTTAPGTTTTTLPSADSCHLKIDQGSGQAIATPWPFGEPLRVKALSPSGQACPGVGVQFRFLEGQDYVAVQAQDTTTDANGFASLVLRAHYLPGSLSYGVTRVEAVKTTGVVSRQEFAVVVLPPANTGVTFPLSRMLVPEPLQTIVVRKNSVTRGAIQFAFGVGHGPGIGQPLPSVGFRISIDEDRNLSPISPTPTFECENVIPLSNASGIASCDIVAGPATGTLPIVIKMFGASELKNLSLEIR